MPEPSPHQPLSRADLRRRLRARLAELGPPLRLLAEEIRGDDEAVIDWVAAEPDGRVVVVLLDLEAGDPMLLAEGLTQRAWVMARLPDWLKLAPGLGVRAELRPALLLLAPRFSRKTRIAAREADPAGIWLGRIGWAGRGPASEPEIDLVRPPREIPLAQQESAATLPAAGFRTGLTDEDLGLTPAERASFG
jgi:hypothetical protein